MTGGRPVLTAYVPKEAVSEERRAAALWNRVLARMGGRAPARKPAIASPESAIFPPGVFIGMTEVGRRLLADHSPKDSDTFAIDVDPERSRVTIVGATPQATYFGVVRFLQKYGGVNWYFPGKLGEIIPRRANWSAAPGLVLEAPAYLSRQFSGLTGPEKTEWARQNLLNSRFEFHHALRRIFRPALFESHPEFFPLRNGERYRPEPNDVRWQPNLANPAVARYAAERAREYFRANPTAASYSLGMNDGNQFDEAPATRTFTESRPSFRGRPDYSDLVFTFMNRAARYLAQWYPDKYLGCLAYRWAENVPSFRVHPQVLPYLVNDRSFYDTASWAEEDLTLIRRWAAAGPRVIGIYDYYYGRPFITPRIFTSAMIMSLRKAHAAGARAFYAELYPRWEYDALKAWLAARLLWDIDANPAALEARFYQDLYGPAAADVRAFFREAELAWREQTGPPRKLKGFRDPQTQAAMFSAARLTTMSTALNRARQRRLQPRMRMRLARLEAVWAKSCKAVARMLLDAERAERPQCP